MNSIFSPLYWARFRLGPELVALLLAASCLTGCGVSSMTSPASGASTKSSEASISKHPVTSADSVPRVVQDVAKVLPVPAIVETVSALSPTTIPDVKLSEVDPCRLVGRWQDSFFGTRTLTLNADWSARMVLDLDFAGQLLYGRQLDFDMRWSVDGTKVVIEIVSGRPEKAARSAMKTWGEVYEYQLECIEDHEIQMRSSDGSMFHKLQRLPAQSEATSR